MKVRGALTRLSLAIGFLTAPLVHARAVEPFGPGFGGALGAAYEGGRLGNRGMGLRDRTMTAESFDGLLGYRFDDRWLLGLHGNFRVQQQQTPLRQAGGTNLAGLGYLLGLGVGYRVSPRWAWQGAIDVFGRYDFDKQTSTALDDHLDRPLSLELRGQYFIARSWSLDVGTGYQFWRTFHVGGENKAEPARQWMVGAGVTYHFGFGRAAESSAISGPPPEAATVAEAAAPAETEVIPPNDLDVPTSFASGSAEVDAASRDGLRRLAAKLAVGGGSKVTVEGYADTSGTERLNHTLSRRRADRVRRILISGGLPVDRVTAIGRGTANPIGDNETEAGRAKNRRVEVRVN